MPRVKIVRNNCSASSEKKITRSMAKIKPQRNYSSTVSKVVPNGKRAIPAPKAKSLTSVGQQKQIDNGANKNEETNKKANNAGNINKHGFTDDDKIVNQSTKQKGIVIYDSEDSSDDGQDSTVDTDSWDSRDDYEPDTEDEEEYRSRSYFW